MNSEKVKEIKKALEQNDYNGIMYEVNDQKRVCKFIHHEDILTLINELESENERLNECYKVKAYDKLRAENKQLKDRIAELESKNENLYNLNQNLISDRQVLMNENELLRNAKVVYENVDYCYEDLKKAEKRIAELEKENETKTDTIANLLKKQEFYEKDKLKQFAERLKEKAIRRQEFIGELVIDDIEYVKTQDIDELLKEYEK